MNRKNSFFPNDEVGKDIELFVQCRNLLNKDLLSKSDPYVILKMKSNKAVGGNSDSFNQNNMWIEVGRTKVIQDNLNPNFIESFIVNYKFEEYQPILFEVWDYDSPTQSEFLGKAECSLGEIVKQSNQALTLNLADQYGKAEYDKQKNPKNGIIIVRYDEVCDSNHICMFQISTEKINISRFNLNLFIRINRKSENGQPILVYESTLLGKTIQNKIIKAKGQKLCNSDYNIPIVFEIWNRGFFGGEEFIGYFEVPINELTQKTQRQREGNQQQVVYNLKQDKSKNSAHLENSQIGSVVFHKAEVISLPSFLDYLRGGTQINLAIGIDFTLSNGDPKNESSLHYFTDENQQRSYGSGAEPFPNIPGKRNQYQRAIQAVGTILMEYDQDKLIPTYGFGAQMFTGVQHAFALNGKKDQPEIYGISGVLEQYKRFIRQGVTLSGPTYFAPLISKCMEQAQKSLNQNRDDYFVLLILTDGIIHDMGETKRLIVDCANLPMSIIIVGVGSANFQDMEELDGDEGLIDSRGKRAQRDLVQFVAFENLEGNDSLLQKEVLSELPDQIVEYHLLCQRLPQGFQFQQHINYIDFTRMANAQQSNAQKSQTSLASFFIMNLLIVIAVGLLLTKIVF